MPATKIRRSSLLALALLMAAAVPVRATTPPTFTVVDSIWPGSDPSRAMDLAASAAFGDYLYFQADDGTTGRELWRSNGTTTTRVFDINTGSGDGSPTNFAVFGDHLYFQADDGTTGGELWRTDGTTTTLVKDIWSGSDGSDPNSSDPNYFAVLGDYLYFQAQDEMGMELWRTDGTTLGTTLVKDINLGPDNSSPNRLTAFGGYLYFPANDGTTGYELWRTDGTAGGTTQVYDVNSGPGDSYPQSLNVLGGHLYFKADNEASYGTELWRTDGTTTNLVYDINPGTDGSNLSGNLNDFAVFGDYLYFKASDGTTGRELWRTNGTSTTQVHEIQSGPDGSNPNNLAVLGNFLYFQANDGTTGDELWRTDGTSTGTTFVFDIRTGEYGSDPEAFVKLGDFLYFTAYDGDEDYVYQTNGTVTQRVPFPIDADQSVDCYCFANSLIAVGGRLFSTVYSAATGDEFAYLDEPTYVLPETNRDGGVGSAWTIALSALALVTLAAGVGLRRRGGAVKR